MNSDLFTRQVVLTAAVLTVAVIAYVPINPEDWVGRIGTFLIPVLAGGIITVIWSSAFESGAITFQRIRQLLNGAEAAGLERVEATLKQGTKADDQCARANHSIRFIGIGGRKFVASLLNEETAIGRKIASGQVDVKLMLLDPSGDQIDSWTRSADKANKVRADIKKTLGDLVPVIERPRSTFHCKVYDFLPPLRILIVDQSIVLVSRYDPASETGWDAPQLCFRSQSSGESSEFTKSFENLFDILWDSGCPLEQRHCE